MDWYVFFIENYVLKYLVTIILLTPYIISSNYVTLQSKRYTKGQEVSEALFWVESVMLDAW